MWVYEWESLILGHHPAWFGRHGHYSTLWSLASFYGIIDFKVRTQNI